MIYEEAASTICRMEELMQKYAVECTDLFEAYPDTDMTVYLRRIVLGTDPYNSSPLHVKYFNNMQSLTNELTAQLTELAEQESEAAAEIAVKAVRMLLRPADEERPYMDFMLIVDDQLTSPMLQYLPFEEIRDAYELLSADKSRYSGIPTQEKLVAELKKMLEAEGMTFPGKTFGQKLKSFFGIMDKKHSGK